MSDERMLRLEEKIAYLERHVTAQDKVMLEMGDALGRIRAELRLLRERSGEGGAGNAGMRGDSGEPQDERPPHY